MKTIESIFEIIEGCRCDSVATSNLAEIEKCGETFDNLRWYMTSDGSKVDLYR
jgi:hypothetical protein